MNTTTREGLLAEEQKYLLANIDALRTRYPLTVVAGGCWDAPTSSRGAGSLKTIDSEEGR